MSSFTVSLSGNTSVLTSTFFPEIVLDENYEYSCGLLDFTTYQSIPNITSDNNRLYYDDSDDTDPKHVLYFISVPVGCYEAEDVLNYIKRELESNGISFDFKVNKNTLKTTIKCSRYLSFDHDSSIHELFGFTCKGVVEFVEIQNRRM